MGKHYDELIIPAELRRTYDVYDRVRELGIDLGSFEAHVGSLKGRNIASAVVHQSGLLYLSGAGGGSKPMNDDPARVKEGQQAAQDIADLHLRTLHWTLSCGGEGDLNDVLYTVKVLGMVVSTDVEFNSGPAVVNGYTARWQSVFGGGFGPSPRTGRTPGATGGCTPGAPSGASPGASPWSRRSSWPSPRPWRRRSSATGAGSSPSPRRCWRR